jgi:eukaryotic-like serine/threonine-protein kinase
MSLISGTRLGPYEILSPLGAGGMGEVYRARDTRLDRDVAVKVLPASFSADPDRLRRFEQEARAVAALNHPNILAIYDIGTHEGSPFLVTELLEGETLRERLQSGALTPRKALEIAAQTAQGVAAAHDKGIVHRDLKPANIFLTNDNRVKILDFGLAKFAQPSASSVSDTQSPTRTMDPQTKAGMVLGTVGYMSPEQVRGNPADGRSDIFSLGAILYEMLSGARPFEKDSTADTMAAILKEDPPELAGESKKIPPAAERIVRHCLEKNPAERFQSARDLSFDLAAMSGVSSASQEHPAIAAERPRKTLWLATAAAVLLASYVAVFFLAKQSVKQVWPNFQRLAFRRGTVTNARFTPDGQTVLYNAAFEGNPLQAFSTRPDSPESRLLGMADQTELLSVSSSGELAVLLKAQVADAVFAWEGTLARVPLAGGAPREILDKVNWADWSPDGKQLAVVHRVASKDTLEYPLGKVLYETQGWIGDPRVSPDGKWVAFLDHPVTQDDEGSVAVVDLSGKRKTLTQTWVSARGLAWSPSGKEVWFTASPEGANRALYGVSLSGKTRLVYRVDGSLKIMDSSRSGQVLLVDENEQYQMIGERGGDAKEQDLSWFDWTLCADLTADGTSVLFTEGGEGGGPSYSVYLRNMDGSQAVRLGDGSGIAISPDGKWVISGDPHKLPEQLILLPTGAGEPRQLTSDSISHASAAWFPDGQQILFTGREAGHGARVYVQDLKGGSPRAVTPEGFGSPPHAVSPDGKWIVARDIVNNKWVLVPADGGQTRPIPGAEPNDIPIQWTPDGRSLYMAQFGNPAKIFRLDIATGKRELWKVLTPADPSGVQGIGPIHITPDGKSYVYSVYRDLTDLYLVKGLK